jgi:hypothetical protein
MIRFANEKELFEFIDDRMRETQTTRQERAHYANRMRARYNGIQWLQRSSGMVNAVSNYFGQGTDWATIYRADNVMKTTVNRTTMMVQQSAAATNFTGMEVITAEQTTSVNTDRFVQADLYESVGNIVTEWSRLQTACNRANLERCIDAMHGVGVKITSYTLDSGVQDSCMKGFEFDGYQLTLDPMNRSIDLRDHEWVMFAEVMTWHAAQREYGDLVKGIDEKELKTVAQLMPNEVAHMALSANTMYTHLQQATNMKALRIVTLWVKGPSKRFDRMFLVADGIGRAGKVAMNYQAPENPYGGCGMPLQCLYGYMRPGEIFAISDVGMMADDQDKLNLAATLYWQQVHDFTTNVVYAVDKGWFGNNRIDENSIMEKIQQGVLIGHSNGVAKFQPPTMMTRPAPSQSMIQDMQSHEAAMRRVVMQTDLHGGSAKTHIADATQQLTVELSEAPIDDRRESDIKAVSAVVDVAAATMIRLIQAQAPSAIEALQEAGMEPAQIGMLMELNPLRPPAKLVVARESVRRRSKGQMKRDLIALTQTGAHQDPFIRASLAALDFPVVESDKSTERWANRMVQLVIRGEMYQPVPMGMMSEVVLDAFRRGMKSDAALDPEVYGRLLQGYQSQLIMDQTQGLPQPGEGEAQQAPPDEVGLDSLVSMLGMGA